METVGCFYLRTSASSADSSLGTNTSRQRSLKKELFNDLVASIKEAGKIHRGEMRASRELAFDPEDVRGASQRPANRAARAKGTSKRRSGIRVRR